ncbi:MAG: DNA replication and repair protein RecF, partial [bacterium]
ILKTALIGPHRDDISFYIDSFPCRTHSSQGELRTTAISLKVAVYDIIRLRKKASPILLLDEIFAELDESRCEMLIRLFPDFGQIFLTTAVLPPSMLQNNAKSFYIKNGKVENER